MEEPANDSVLHTMEASSKMAMRMRSRSRRLRPLASLSAPSLLSTMESMDTARMEWCTLTPIRTMLGAYMFPSLSMRPDLSMRMTISSRALLEGAHTSTWARGPLLAVTRVGTERRSRPKQSSPDGGASSVRISSLGLGSPLSQGACFSHSRTFSSSPKPPTRAADPPSVLACSSSAPLCALCITTDRRLRMVRVLPVPGGPWISTQGVPSRPAHSASICEGLHCLSMVVFMPGGMSICRLSCRARGLPLMRMSMKGQSCECCSATHSRVMVDMLLSLSRYQVLFLVHSPARMARTLVVPLTFPAWLSSVMKNLMVRPWAPAWASQ
mmetsp:Transcript_32954/g.72836  ORF Transcript_32954/g.72836 Transcript_32954/m.72836 type:complete len:326 (+) Transcript_32954:1045-2022(+)